MRVLHLDAGKTMRGGQWQVLRLVTGLAAGVYSAKWVLTDSNGDTRTVRTRFVEEP